MKNNYNNYVRFETDTNIGLSSLQVKNRIKENLINKKIKKYSKSYLSIFTSNIFTFFNLLGLIVFISLVVAKASLGNFFFSIIYLANILIGIIQEIRAKKCIDKLTLVTSKGTTVIRDGKKVKISNDQIVLDDLLLFGIGNQIPVDCIIKEGYVETNESLLTGESIAVKKHIGDILYAGSFITSGHCKAIADKIGKESYVEKISAKAKTYKKPYSELMTSLRLMIKSISLLIIPIATILVFKAILKNQDYVSIINSVSGSVIGMIPSGMFLLTSIALAVGIIKLAKCNTLVQDLYSLEMLARADTICFDKTGTLTNGEMVVDEIVPFNSFEESEINKIVSSMLYALNDVNQTSDALKEKFGIESFYESIAILPFNSKRKFSAVTFENQKTYTLGAPEFILEKNNYNEIIDTINFYAKKGLRVIVVAESDKKITETEIPEDFKAIALITIADSIRKEAIDTIKWFNENDVSIKVISGDNPYTVSEIAKRVGINNAEKYISLEGLNDQEVYNSANKYTVFGRVSPEQKAILVKALKDAGHTTAMTGDGVNDILALKESDCAITVASGSEAARNISHIVLMDNNFNSMPNVVYEGRRVINNINSSASLYIMKTLFTIILTIITLFIPLFEKYPFQNSNLILIEVFIIGLPSFFLSLQPNDQRVKGKFISTVIEKSLPSAILMVLSVLIVFISKKFLPNASEEIYTTMAVTAFTFSGLISLFNICSPFNKYRLVLFGVSAFIIFTVLIYSIFNGFILLDLTNITPFSDYWPHLLLIACLLLVELPLSLLIKNLSNKIKNLKNKKEH